MGRTRVAVMLWRSGLWRHDSGPLARTRRRTMRLAGASLLIAMQAAVAAADCTSEIRLFAMLASTGLDEEAVNTYRSLPAACHRSLPLQAGRPPAASDDAGVLRYGKAVYEQQKQQASAGTAQALAAVDVSNIDQRALAGLGPENASQALGGMMLDVLASGLDSRQRSAQANAAREFSALVNKDQPQWWRADTGGAPTSPVGGVPSGEMASGPAGRVDVSRIEVPASTIAAADCGGDLGFLAPHIHDYPDPLLRGYRNEILNTRILPSLREYERYAGSQEHAKRFLQQEIRDAEASAAESRETANSTDGRGEAVTITEVDNLRLSIELKCGSTSIHASGVCNYIAMRHASLTFRTLLALADRCAF